DPRSAARSATTPVSCPVPLAGEGALHLRAGLYPIPCRLVRACARFAPYRASDSSSALRGCCPDLAGAFPEREKLLSVLLLVRGYYLALPRACCDEYRDVS